MIRLDVVSVRLVLARAGAGLGPLPPEGSRSRYYGEAQVLRQLSGRQGLPNPGLLPL